MANFLCPPWLGYFLLNPLRKLLENPDKILAPFIKEGMTILEPGCGMGYFTLPMARMVGPDGRVVIVEVQQKMLTGLDHRARKAGLSNRIEHRLVGPEGLGVEDLSDKVDLTVAIHMVHEVPDQTAFFLDVWKALKPGGRLLLIEPKGHVSIDRFKQSMATAERIGFKPDASFCDVAGRKALLIKHLPDEAA